MHTDDMCLPRRGSRAFEEHLHGHETGRPTQDRGGPVGVHMPLGGAEPHMPLGGAHRESHYSRGAAGAPVKAEGGAGGLMLKPKHAVTGRLHQWPTGDVGMARAGPLESQHQPHPHPPAPRSADPYQPRLSHGLMNEAAIARRSHTALMQEMSNDDLMRELDVGPGLPMDFDQPLLRLDVASTFSVFQEPHGLMSEVARTRARTNTHKHTHTHAHTHTHTHTHTQ